VGGGTGVSAQSAQGYTANQLSIGNELGKIPLEFATKPMMKEKKTASFVSNECYLI
jgi:hypothetical protein